MGRYGDMFVRFSTYESVSLEDFGLLGGNLWSNRQGYFHSGA